MVKPKKTKEPRTPISRLESLNSSLSGTVMAGIIPWSMFKMTLAIKMKKYKKLTTALLYIDLSRVSLLSVGLASASVPL
jgi:hypothetical protein